MRFFEPPASKTILRHGWTFCWRSRFIVSSIHHGRRQFVKTQVMGRDNTWTRLDLITIWVFTFIFSSPVLIDLKLSSNYAPNCGSVGHNEHCQRWSDSSNRMFFCAVVPFLKWETPKNANFLCRLWSYECNSDFSNSPIVIFEASIGNNSYFCPGKSLRQAHRVKKMSSTLCY